jgi:pimeloyl-ACP methyl ester carboxylesterase
MAERRVEANGLGFHLLEEGEGYPVLLLHGFPDSSHLWRNQIPALAAAGFRVIAPDLRGFGRSDKPAAVEAYLITEIMADVLGVMDALGVQRAHVVGHDWGAVVAWFLGSFAPERVEKLVALSVGHPATFASAPVRQLRRSWYFFMFQFRGVAEDALRRNDWRLLKAWGDGGGDTERWIRDLSRPGALTAGLNWYRANATPELILLLDPLPYPKVAAPTLGIQGTEDFALIEDLMIASGEHVAEGFRYERIHGAGHWLPTEQPERINQLLTGFLSA